MSKNIFKQFDTPGDAAVKHTKSQAFARVIREIRKQGWTPEYVLENFQFTAEEIVQMNQGDLFEIPLDKLVHALGTMGFDVDLVWKWDRKDG
jgi:hypothetical protein